MIESILTKLDDVSFRYEEIESLLSKPDITSNQEEFIKLSREYADLSPVVNAFNAFHGHTFNRLNACNKSAGSIHHLVGKTGVNVSAGQKVIWSGLTSETHGAYGSETKKRAIEEASKATGIAVDQIYNPEN